jgi:hypothetical protein
MIEGHYPLFYDYHNGFDYQKYAKLLAAADYWDMEKLQTWIKKKKYEEVVKINISSGETLGPPKGTVQGGIFYEHHPQLSIRKFTCVQKGQLFIKDTENTVEKSAINSERGQMSMKRSGHGKH